MEYSVNNFDYPVQESYQNNLAQSFAPAFQTPAMDAYQNYLGSAPRRDDFQGNFLQKLLAGIAGFSTGMRNPMAGVQTSLGIMDTPYLRAMQEYQSMEPGLRQAATIEERSLGDRMNAMRYQQQGQMDRMKSDRDFQIEKIKMDNAFKIAAMNAQTDMDRARITQEHQRAMEALEAQRIGVMREGNQMDLLQSLNPMNVLAKFARPQQAQQPNASLMNFQLQQKLQSDPIFANVMTPKGPDPAEMNEQQFVRYQQILSEMGINPPTPYYLSAR